MDGFLLYMILLGMGLIIFSLSNSINGLKQDLYHMNKLLNKVAIQVGVSDITVEGDSDAELIELILNNKKIEAIKRYRILTGLGLKESKDYIDQLDPNVRK